MSLFPKSKGDESGFMHEKKTSTFGMKIPAGTITELPKLKAGNQRKSAAMRNQNQLMSSSAARAYLSTDTMHGKKPSTT
jgi:hypothetical protein